MGERQYAHTLFETPFWTIILNKNDQRYLGRCMVILKRPCGDLADLTDEEFIDFKNVVQRLESAARQAFTATMFNWSCLMNLAYRKKPSNPQVHWHFRPRYDHIVTVDGKEFQDPNFGSHYLQDEGDEIAPSEKILQEIAVILKRYV